MTGQLDRRPVRSADEFPGSGGGRVRIVVTGAAGFIGADLSAKLLLAGDEVVGIDRLRANGTSGVRDARLCEAWSVLCAADGFQAVEADLLEVELEPLLAGADVVVHLAGRPGTHDSWANYGSYLRDNVEATARLLSAAANVGRPRIVHGSSSSVYGRVATGREDAELIPASPYGVSKLAGEATVRAYEQASGLSAVILRFFSVYGRGQRPDMGIHRAIQATLTGQSFSLFGDGRQTRTLTHVDDLSNGLIRVIRSPQRTGTFNLGGTAVVSMLEVLDEIAALMSRSPSVGPVPDPPGNQQHVTADSSLAAAVFGFHPVTGLTAGLRDQIDWQRSSLEPGRQDEDRPAHECERRASSGAGAAAR